MCTITCKNDNSITFYETRFPYKLVFFLIHESATKSFLFPKISSHAVLWTSSLAASVFGMGWRQIYDCGPVLSFLADVASWNSFWTPPVLKCSLWAVPVPKADWMKGFLEDMFTIRASTTTLQNYSRRSHKISIDRFIVHVCAHLTVFLVLCCPTKRLLIRVPINGYGKSTHVCLSFYLIVHLDWLYGNTVKSYRADQEA